MPGKQILQSTFDAIVREAMSDFGLSAEEAVADAREQLSKAGVTDFSNLVDPTVGGSGNRHDEEQGNELPSKIRDALDNGAPSSLLSQLLSQLASAGDTVAAIAGSNGAVVAVVDALACATAAIGERDWELANAACAATVALCRSNEANRSRFLASQESAGVQSLKLLLEALTASIEKDCDVHFDLVVLQAITTVQRRSELVKRKVASDGFLETLLRLLRISERGMRTVPDLERHAGVFREVCAVLRQSLTADDTTATISETFNRARIVTGGGTISESGLRPLGSDDTLPRILHCAALFVRDADDIPEALEIALLRDCVTLARLCAVSDEACSDLVSMGFHTFSTSLLQEKSHVAAMVSTCLKLLRNLAQRDECKTALYADLGTVQDVVELYLEESYVIMEYFSAFLASLCLRRPDLSRKTVGCGAFELLLRGMELHPSVKGVQRAACLAIRNAASRDAEARRQLVESGRAEAAVRRAWKAFPRDCDELAYSALRDLDVLADDELRRDDRYTMPAGFFSIKPSKVAQTGVGFDDSYR